MRYFEMTILVGIVAALSATLIVPVEATLGPVPDQGKRVSPVNH